jgi:ribosomal protein S18 acetylase RimI-like enzyme
MVEVVMSDMASHEVNFAAGVLARGLRDQPNVIAVYGDDPLRRMRALERMFRSSLPTMKQPPLCARRGDWIVGVCAMAPPDTCQLSPLERLRAVPALLMDGPGAMSRSLRWQAEWGKRDLKERHWHLGPVAVEPGLQGFGVGSHMMERFCARMDDEGEVAYLETEKPENVRFYERFGFETVKEVEVLDRPNWFMRREPPSRQSG